VGGDSSGVDARAGCQFLPPLLRAVAASSVQDIGLFPQRVGPRFFLRAMTVTCVLSTDRMTVGLADLREFDPEMISEKYKAIARTFAGSRDTTQAPVAW
jgi:hypothetical protein